MNDLADTATRGHGPLVTRVRLMIFHSLFTGTGITGCMSSTFCVFFYGQKLRLVLYWNGTLISLLTGFCTVSPVPWHSVPHAQVLP